MSCFFNKILAEIIKKNSKTMNYNGLPHVMEFYSLIDIVIVLNQLEKKEYFFGYIYLYFRVDKSFYNVNIKIELV